VKVVLIFSFEKNIVIESEWGLIPKDKGSGEEILLQLIIQGKF